MLHKRRHEFHVRKDHPFSFTREVNIGDNSLTRTIEE